ncbi:MAG: proton-conducting transporter membrane subunit [Candidatus Nezhaarchaeales archaeon]
METQAILNPLFILLAGAIIVVIVEQVGRRLKLPKLTDATAVVFFALTLISLYQLYLISKGQTPPVLTYSLKGLGGPFGVSFVVDGLSLFMAFLFAGLGLLVSIYSIRYMEKDLNLDRYYSLLMTLVAGMIGVVFAGDLFNLFVFWETMSISSYSLVAFRKYRWEPIEASFKYLTMSTVGSLMVLYAISFLYGLTGTLNIYELARILGASPIRSQLLAAYFLVACVVAGFGVTGAMVPFHFWLPDAHPAAPSGISAMLSGVVIKAGVYGIARVLFTVFNPNSFDFGTVLMVFGVITLTVANLAALLQRDIKRLLAYSSIVNIGYILSGLGIGAYVITHYQPPLSLSVAGLAVMGALFHIFNHAIGKGLLFLCAGCFIHEAKTRDISMLEGIGKHMAITGASFSIGLLGLAGVPPLSGFWSKLFIILAGYSITWDPFMIVVTTLIVLNSIFAATYYVWLMQRIMFRESKVKAKEAPASMILPIVILALLCVVVGLMPGWIIEAAGKAGLSLISYVGG